MSGKCLVSLVALLLGVLVLGSGAQEPGPDAKELLERIRRERDQVPVEVFEQLGARADRAGLEALIAGIPLLDEYGPLRAAYKALRHFATDPKLAKQAVAFLADEMEQSVTSRRWGAPRALPVFGAAGAKALEEAARSSSDPYLRSRAVEALLPELRLRGDAESLALLFECCDPGTDKRRAQLVEALADFKGKRMGRALAAGLAEQSVTSELKCLFVRGLTPVVAEDIDAALAKSLGSKDRELVLACIRALRERGHDGHVRALKRLARQDDFELRYAAMRGLMSIPKAEEKGNWTQRLFDGLDAKRVEERSAATAALLELRTRKSIPALIARLEREPDANLRRELAGGLRLLTGLDHGSAAGRWASWWERKGADFVLPGVDAAVDAGLERRRAAWRRTKRYDFYGLKVESRKVCFVVDASGSMNAKNAIGITRLEIAKRQLSDSLDRFPDGGFFNVLFFGTRVESFAPDLIEMTPEIRAEIAAHIEARKTLGLTAMYDALREAFRSREVDTVYLLSDGLPTGGEVDDVDEVRAQVAGWNIARKLPITIHCVAIGQGHSLLSWLAEDSGGEYVEAAEE